MHDRDLLSLQIETLYRCAADGRLLTVNEPEGMPAPLVFLGRTRVGNLWRCRHDLPAPLVAEVERICRAEPTAADFAQLPVGLSTLLRLLGNSPQPPSVWRGPAYVFEQRATPPPDVVTVDDTNRHLLARWFGDSVTIPPDCSPQMLLVDGVAVALCFSSRVTPRACEAGIETAQPYRKRGYAARVATAWAAAIQASGRIALYSTSWDNQASQGVARHLGLRQYGEDVSIG